MMSLDEIIELKAKTFPLLSEKKGFVLEKEEVETAVRNFCNISGDLPDALRFTIANMVIDLSLKNEIASGGTSEGSGEGSDKLMKSIKSMKIGDTSIDFDGSSSSSEDTEGKAQGNVDEVLFDYKAQLIKFRKMVW